MTTPARDRQARVKAMQEKPGSEEESVPEPAPEPSPELRPRDYKAVLDERYPSTTGPQYEWLLGWIEEWVPIGLAPDSWAEWDAAFIAIGAQRRAFTEEMRAAVDAALAEVHRRLPLSHEALAWRHSLEGTRQWPWAPAGAHGPVPEPAS